MSGTIAISGASRGLGVALARSFARANWRIIPLIRNPADKLRLTEAGMRANDIFVHDMTSSSLEASLTTHLKAANVEINVLINNAGLVGEATELMSLDSDSLQKSFQVNCVLAMRITKSCWPHMLTAADPMILNVSSRFGSITRNLIVEESERVSYEYRISKAALNMATACLHQELSPKGAIVCAIHPGELQTDMNRGHDRISAETSAEQIKQFVLRRNQNDSARFLHIFGTTLPW